MKSEFINFKKNKAKELDDYILSIWTSFEEFRQDFKNGGYITLPKELIIPSTFEEWTDATEGASRTSTPIQLHREHDTAEAELCIYDGHNRLKDILANKSITKIRCEVRPL